MKQQANRYNKYACISKPRCKYIILLLHRITTELARQTALLSRSILYNKFYMQLHLHVQVLFKVLIKFKSINSFFLNMVNYINKRHLFNAPVKITCSQSLKIQLFQT